MTSLRRNWDSVSAARLERAIGRALRTLPMLRYHGDCLGCGSGLAQNHAFGCPVKCLETALMHHRGTISGKEVRHYTFRKSQAKA